MDTRRQREKVDLLEALERFAPWLVLGLILACIIMSIVMAAAGRPWWR